MVFEKRDTVPVLPPEKSEVDPRTAEVILAAVASLEFGSVEVLVHQGRVVQIDKRERIRLKGAETSREERDQFKKMESRPDCGKSL